VGDTNEITQFQPLLDGVDLTGAVITADALHAQHGHAEWLVGVKHATYLLVVKVNQPRLPARHLAMVRGPRRRSVFFGFECAM
jgi:predicted transposase YbfD/YdcC